MGSVSFQMATCQETPRSGHCTNRARRTRFQSQGLSFPTQPEPLGGATSCAEEPGSQAGSSQKRDSNTERWTKGGLVELIRCHMFRGASPEIHR